MMVRQEPDAPLVEVIRVDHSRTVARGRADDGS